jgi:hypothetical protein
VLRRVAGDGATIGAARGFAELTIPLLAATAVADLPLRHRAIRLNEFCWLRR